MNYKPIHITTLFLLSGKARRKVDMEPVKEFVTEAIRLPKV